MMIIWRSRIHTDDKAIVIIINKYSIKVKYSIQIKDEMFYPNQRRGGACSKVVGNFAIY